MKRAWRLAGAMAATAVQGCATPAEQCGLASCGVERGALLQVTAAQLSAPLTNVTIYDIRHYPDATVAWRARSAGQEYQCREARDDADPSRVHFVYCRPST